jgi:hypothetical protein
MSEFGIWRHEIAAADVVRIWAQGGLPIALVNVASEREVDENRWDNFKNTLWDSMERLRRVGQDKHLKLLFICARPWAPSTKIRF